MYELYNYNVRVFIHTASSYLVRREGSNEIPLKYVLNRRDYVSLRRETMP